MNVLGWVRRRFTKKSPRRNAGPYRQPPENIDRDPPEPVEVDLGPRTFGAFLYRLGEERPDLKRCISSASREHDMLMKGLHRTVPDVALKLDNQIDLMVREGVDAPTLITRVARISSGFAVLSRELNRS